MQVKETRDEYGMMMKSKYVEMLIAAQYFNLRFDGFGNSILRNQNAIYLKNIICWIFLQVPFCISWEDQFNLAGAGGGALRENKYLQFITVK